MAKSNRKFKNLLTPLETSLGKLSQKKNGNRNYTIFKQNRYPHELRRRKKLEY